MLNFTKWFFCIYWDGHMVFVLSFMDAVYHTDFAYAEPSLWLWDENDTDLRWKMSDTIPFYLSLLLTHSRFPVCALSLWWGTWHSGKILPGIERLKSHWMLVKIDSWSIMLSEKGLDQKGEMWKLTKANLTKTEMRDQKGELSCIHYTAPLQILTESCAWHLWQEVTLLYYHWEEEGNFFSPRLATAQPMEKITILQTHRFLQWTFCL